MAQPGTNPYARPVERTDGAAPNPTNEYIWGGPGRYSVKDVPESTDPEYTTGYSPALAANGSPDGTMLPSDIRIGSREAPPNDPNDRDYNATVYSEQRQRYSVEQTTVGWKVQQHTVQRPIVPEWTQDRLPVRPTADMAPAGYQFQRPWHIPRNIKDAVGEDAVTHFSMADHKRVTEIYGMAPQGRLGANTYRANPRPWDAELYYPPDDANLNGAVYGNRSFRLGG